MAKTKKHPGTIVKRGNSYRVILYVEGERLQFTLKDVTHAQAAAFATREHTKLTEAAKRRKLGLPGMLRFSGLVKKFREVKLPLVAPRTRVTYGRSLDRAEEFFKAEHGDPAVEDIRGGHIHGFIDWRRLRRLRGSPKGTEVVEGTSSARTITKDRAVLHALFGYAQELELVQGNPVAKVAAPKGDQRNPVILSNEQFEKLLGECEDPMLRLFVLTMAETGARSESEVLHVRWEDVDLKDGFLLVRSGRDGHRTKSGKDRWVPMTRRLGAAMREHFAAYRLRTYGAKPTPWVFHHARSRRRAAEGDRIGSMRRAFISAAERAELPPGLHQHDLRHRRVTTWLAGGANPVHVKEAV
jgi:integrase